MTGTLHPHPEDRAYSPDETYQRAMIVTGDPVFANKLRQAARRARDAAQAAVCTLCGRPAVKVAHPAGELWYCETCGTGDYIAPVGELPPLADDPRAPGSPGEK